MSAMTTNELLNQALQESNRSTLEKAIEYSVAIALASTAVPKGDEIHALSKMNPKTPVYAAFLKAFETEFNERLASDLSPPLVIFTEIIDFYMRITPSTGKSQISRADSVLETLKIGRALQRQPDMGGRMPFLPVEESVPPSTEQYK